MGLLQRILGKPEGQLTTVNDQSQSDREIVSFVKNRVDEARAHPSRIAFEGITMTNIAYLVGYDGVYFDPKTRQFRQSAKSSPALKRNRIFVNKILPTIQNRTARLCKNPPKFDIRPESPDAAEKDRARFKLQVLEQLWEKQKINRKRVPLYMWMQEAGHAYVKVAYDPELGNLMLDPASGQMIFEGDVRADVVSALEVFTDPLAKDFDDLGWLAHCRVRKLDYFRMHYPERGHLVKEEGPWLLSAQDEQRIQSLNNVNGSQGSPQAQMKNAAIEIAYYEKRSNKHPEGRMIVTANGVLLEDKQLPLGEIPFAKFDDIVIGGKYNSEAIITHMRPMQDNKNDLLSSRRAFFKKLLAGKYIAAKGHGLAAEALNDQSGEVVEYTPVPNAQPPQALTAPQMPQYVYQEEESIDRNFDDIAGINEVSKGQLPAAGIPAIGMQLLTEQDDTRIGIMTMLHEEAWARVGMLMLKCAEKFYKTPRKLKIAGKDQEYIVKEFTGAELEGDHEVIVVPGSTLPGSKTLKRQEIINAWQQGLLGDPADPKVREKVLGMLEFGDVAEMWKKQSLDDRQARIYLDLIQEGIAPPVSEFDNNEYLCMKFNEFRLERIDSLDERTRAVLDQALNERVQFLMGQIDPAIAAENEGITPESISAGNPLGPEGIDSNSPESIPAMPSGPTPEPEPTAEAF